MEDFVPVVDASSLHGEGGVDPGGAYAQTCSSIVEAFCTSGFVCLSNHGIPEEDVDRALQVSAVFFAKDIDIKKKFARVDHRDVHGWVGIGSEGFDFSLNPERPGDYKEGYDITIDDDMVWPGSEICPDFKEAMTEVFQKCDAFSKLILKAIGVGLGLKDSDYFVKAHSVSAEVGNKTTLRVLEYPPLPSGIALTEKQVRCGEHSDWGSITLVFQDGGLEVQTPGGKWWCPPHVPGTVLVNVGDMLQRWTSDKLISTMHRVMAPVDEAAKKKTRRSLVFFVQPSNDCVVECIDGSNKYPAVNALEYLNTKLVETYKILL